MNDKIIEEYKDYMNKTEDRKALYKAVVKKYDIQTAIYPGSHIDITPSFFIPKVTHIDNFKGAEYKYMSLESNIKLIFEQELI